MAIRVIREDDRLVALLQAENLEGEKFGEKFEFYYRQMPGDVLARIQRKHTKKGVLDIGEFALECVRWGCRGWADGVVVDRDGNHVGFSEEIVPTLPGSIRDDLFALIVPSRTEEGGDPLPRSRSTGEPS